MGGLPVSAGKSDPYVEISRENADGTWSSVHKTEVVMKTLNPTWKEFSIPVRVICNGDYERRLQFSCYDWDRDGSHDLIGTFHTNVIELTSGKAQYELINPKKKRKKKKYRNSGVVSGVCGGRGKADVVAGARGEVCDFAGVLLCGLPAWELRAELYCVRGLHRVEWQAPPGLVAAPHQPVPDEPVPDCAECCGEYHQGV